MKNFYSCVLLILLFSAGLHSKAIGCPAPGTYSVGPTGNYNSVTAVIADLNTCASITGPYIFEFQPAYNSSVETFPLTIPFFAGSSGSNTITFRPQASAANISITSANPTGTLLMNGASYVIFDGRPGGSGAAGNLVIENTNAGASYAMQFINDASNNTIHYCKIKSASNSSTGGTIIFSTAGAGTGNDNNTVSNNDIFDAAAGTPVNAVYQSGSASPNDNSNNSISGNNIYNFFSAAADMNGVLLADNASSWTISGNSFYQTVTPRNVTGSGNIFSAVRSLATTVTSLTVSGNYIGGTSASAGGTALTLTGSGRINAIMLIAGSSVANEVQSNTIKNISLTTSADGRNALINLATGKFNVGTVATPNTIGSQSSTGNILVSLSSSATYPNNPTFEGISAGTGTADIVNISSNTIGGISISGTSTTAYSVGIFFYGTTGTFTVDKNIVGSTTTAGSFVSALRTYVFGIWGWASTASTTHTISNNKIANLSSTNTASNNLYLCGILTQGASAYNTTGNEVYKLTTSSSSSTSNSLLGIYNSAATATGQSITNNKVYSLANITPSAASGVVGIYYTGPTSGTNVVSGNIVHSFNLSTSSVSGYMHGIYSVGGLTTFSNNMIRLGIKEDGTSLSTGYIIYGISEKGGASAPLNSFYHNSVYIGGTCTSSASKTYCFFSSVANNTRNYSDNIFYNARSSSSTAGGPRHYGCYIANLTNLTCNYNDIIATGTDKMIFSLNGVDYSTLSAWRTATGKDANSISSDPKYIAPTGSSSSVDLHINGSAYTLVEGSGTPIASVTTDYDAQLRASYTPTDLGADAIANAAATKIDVGVTALAAPAAASCFSNAIVVKVTIKNYAASTVDFSVTPVTVSVAVTGAVTQNLTGTISTGALTAGSSTDVTMSATLDMTTLGTYTFNSTIASVANTGVDADITNNDLLPAATRTATGSGVSWIGITTDWNNAANWCGGIPDATTNVTIPDLGVSANYPVISSGASGTTNNISIATNASVTVNANATLTISGVITNNGGIVDNGAIVLNGTSSTNFPGNGSVNAINDLIISKTSGGTVTFNKAFEISGVFTPTSGNIIVNNTVTLRSTDDSTARVGQSGASYTYGDSGNFEVQRYIPAKRAWRLLTSPVSAAGNIYDNWQNAGIYNAGKGTLVTGPGANPGTNGLDVSTQNNYSLKMWDISSQSLYGVDNTLTTDLSNSANPVGAENTGYFMFVRGDRDPANTTITNVNTTTLSGKGYLQTGTQTFSAAASSGDPSVHRFTLVGNPYASPIDFNLLTKTNLLDKFYVWDPVPLDVGRFVTITKSGGSYIATPDRGAGGPNQYIQSGQAFYIETDVNTGITPLLTVQETHKVSNNILTIFRPAARDNSPEGMRINLYRLNTTDNTASLADGVYALYNNAYSKEISTDDAAKFTNINETFGLVKNGKTFAVQTNPVIDITDTLQLKLTRMSRRDYRLEFKPEQLNHNNLAAFLEDKFLHTNTPLNANSNTLVDFSITSDPLSAAADRFKVVFRPSVTYASLNAAIENSSIAVQWELPQEINISKYIVERSSDGNTFSAIGEKISAGNSEAKMIYKLLDENVAPGEYYYRIKSISKNEVIGYSNIVKVTMMRSGAGMYVFPNPVKENNIGLQLNDMPAGLYTIRLTNNLGQQVLKGNILHSGGTSSQKITSGTGLMPGIYQLEVAAPDKKTSTLKVLVQ